DLQKATKYASYAGEFFGYFLMVNGFFTIFSGSILNGVWFIFIGWVM
ncbi:MAG TPA: site-2 protease family protein, partial [Eubacteriaceae bacterium]|nr:site-2 protease family protein [Eubacteriaceae bacterium]